MSQGIYIIDLDRLGLPRPKTLGEFWGLIEGAGQQRIGRNPKFVELARRLEQEFPASGQGATAWLTPPSALADQLQTAVWNLALPQQSWARVLSTVVSEGTSLGLGLLADQIGFGFLPTGEVVPPERQDDWAYFQHAASSELQPAQDRKDKLRLQLESLFAQKLAAHDFVSIPPPAEGYYKGVGGMFVRAVEAGRQQVDFYLVEYYGEYRCEVYLRGYCPDIREVKSAATGRHLAEVEADYVFKADGLGCGVDIETDEQVGRLVSCVETSGVWYLDRARDIKGVDWLHNSSQSPVKRSLSLGYTGLIAAYLAKNPAFDRLLADLQERAKTADGKHPARTPTQSEQLAAVVQCLRSRPFS